MLAIDSGVSSSPISLALKWTSLAPDHAGAFIGDASTVTVTGRKVNAEFTREKNPVKRSMRWRLASSAF